MIRTSLYAKGEVAGTNPGNGILTRFMYAYSGGGRRVKEVDVSIDGGKTWSQAMMEGHPEVRHE